MRKLIYSIIQFISATNKMLIAFVDIIADILSNRLMIRRLRRLNKKIKKLVFPMSFPIFRKKKKKHE